MDTVFFTAHFKRRICQYNYPGFRSFVGLQQAKCLYIQATDFAQAFSFCAKKAACWTEMQSHLLAACLDQSSQQWASQGHLVPQSSRCCTELPHSEHRHQHNQPQLKVCYRKAKLCYLEAWKCGLELKTGSLLSPHLFFPDLFIVTRIDCGSSQTVKSYQRQCNSSNS